MWNTIATWQFSLQAVKAAAETLQNGGLALDALENGIHTVETDPEIESIGRGGKLNADGNLELDAAIMDGDTLKTGAVVSVKGFEHPITIARAVMEKTCHTLLASEGAERFARSVGIAEASREYLIPEATWQEWLKDKQTAISRGHDTIGMIVMDTNGRLTVGTSTSGASLKLPGRVGDSPIIGSGFYAESGVGAAAATGLGEDIMRTCCSFRCVDLMREGMNAQQAVDTVVLSAHNRLIEHGLKPDCIALVCMDAHGNMAGAANHKGFGYAVCGENIPAQVIEVKPVIDKDSVIVKEMK